MSILQEKKEKLVREMEKLHARNELSRTVGPDYYEPGMMEYLDQSDGSFDEDTGELVLRFESKGTRYDGRTEQIEKVRLGDEIRVVRDPGNLFNHNNFELMTERGHSVGNMPAELCNAIAPLYDTGDLIFLGASVSYVEPISKRSRHAKQAMLFVELRCRYRQTGQTFESRAETREGSPAVVSYHAAAEETQRRAEEETRKQAEEEARRRAEEEARKRAEEEARKRAEEEARKQAEEEARKRAEEEARRRAGEEERRIEQQWIQDCRSWEGECERIRAVRGQETERIRNERRAELLRGEEILRDRTLEALEGEIESVLARKREAEEALAGLAFFRLSSKRAQREILSQITDVVLPELERKKQAAVDRCREEQSRVDDVLKNELPGIEATVRQRFPMPARPARPDHISPKGR